ncbi:MAG: DUF4382 domain-containing protein, partial [Desulfobacterales bacterium]|nr:DUF4382 domain-containing protein [Desulfobacterales bacterium]
MKNKRKWALLFGLVFILALTACGGGGGSSEDTSAQGSTAGTMAVMLTDSPADEYDHIWIDITRAELLPENGSDPIVIFNPDQPVRYDLLSLRAEDEQDGGALLTLADVPVGVYGKIRLEIAENQGSASAEAHVVVGEKILVDGSSEFTYFKLPSGKIDLNFRGGVQVAVGSTIVVTVDIDCAKSIHVSGNHKNFRPVVFVNVEIVADFQLCPRVLHGTIESLVLNDDGQTVGFNLAIPHSNIAVPILLNEETDYIDAEGNSVDAQTLEVGDWVHARGKLQEGGLLASMVVVGDVDLFSGTVTQAVTGDQFALDLDFDHNPDGQTIILRPETLILWACDVRFTPDAIQPGMRARIIGKEQADGSIVAVAVLLRPQLLSGLLTAVEPATGGHTLTINTTPDSEPAYTTLFLPILAPIHVQFDGMLTPDQLAETVACQPRSVTLGVAPTNDPSLTAGWVTVLPDALNTTVSAVDLDSRLLETAAGTVYVQPLA